MYINSIFASFDDLSRQFGLPRSSLFRYFQVCNFLRHQDPNFPHLPSPSGLDDLLGTTFSFKGLISRINTCIYSCRNTTLAKIKADWVDELGEDLEGDIWDSALLRVNGSTCCQIKHNTVQNLTSHPLLQSQTC